MAASIRIPETRNPSYFNRYSITGALLATTAILGLAASFIVPPVLAGGALVTMAGIGSNATAVGITAVLSAALVGTCALLGAESVKNGIATNRLLGRVVSPPAMMNRELTNGILKGAALGLAAMIGLALTPLAATAAGPFLMAGLGGAALAGAGWWGYSDATKEYNRQAVDYDAARQMASQMGAAPERSKGLGDMLGLTSPKPQIATPDKAPMSALHQANDNAASLTKMAKMTDRVKPRPGSAVQQALESREQGVKEAGR